MHCLLKKGEGGAQRARGACPLGEGGAQRGTCQLMCPETERLRREEQGQLSIFEIDNSSTTSGTRRYCTSASLAVKEYVRSGAGQDVPRPQDLRPPPTLKNTIQYLIRDVSSRADSPWHLVYDFVDNRIRAIRQDITYQQLAGVEILYIYALASRFYLYSCYRLSSVSMEKFDPKLNRDQLQQCLLKLVKMDAVIVPTLDLEIPLEEFESYFLLANLGSTEAVMHTLELPKETRQHPKVRLALAISFHFLDNNFIRFFRLTRRLSPLGRCAILPHLTFIRRRALGTMSSAYSSKNAQFPLSLLADWLAFSSLKDAVEFTSAYGIEISGENILFRRGAFKIPAEEPRLRFLIPELDSDSPSNCIFGL